MNPQEIFCPNPDWVARQKTVEERKKGLKKAEFAGKLLWKPNHRSKANEPTRDILP